MRLYERIIAGLIRHPRGAVAAGALVTAVAVFLLSRLEINPDVNSLIRRDDPTRRLTTRLLGDAPLSRTLVVVLRAERADLIEAVLPALVESLRSSPLLKRVTATREEFIGPRLEWMKQAPLYFLPEGVLEHLKSRLASPTERRAELEAGKRLLADPLGGKDIFLGDPLGLRWIFDEAADAASARFPGRLRAGSSFLLFEKPAVAFLRGVGNGDSFDLAFTAKLMKDLDRRLNEALGGGPVRAELAGGYVTATAQSRIMERDIKIQFISSAVAVLLFLLWFTRSWIASHAIFVPIVLAIVWGLGYGSWALGPLTPIAMSMAAMVAGVGGDFPMYILGRFWAERASRGRDEQVLCAWAARGRR